MAPFDPVRDAVLNSPIVAPTSSQPPFPSHYSNRSDSPTTAPTSSPFDPLASPSLGRRATDLSVLLNAEPEEPRSPVRSSSLSHLLLHTDLQPDKLPDVNSLRRISNPDIKREESSYFPPQRPSSSHSQSNQHRPSTPTSSQSFIAGPSRIITASPVPQSPVVTNSRPSSSSILCQASLSTMTSHTTSSPKMPPPPPPSRPPPIEYKPRNRITPAGSVLQPITPEEIESYRNTYSLGVRRLKRKRENDDAFDVSEQRRIKKLAGDVGVVVEHYNARPDVGVKQRRESPIIGLKNFNNWVKSVLISRFAYPALAASPLSNHQLAGAERSGKGVTSRKVLDLGCGKGGDLNKWSKARIKEYMGVDIAAKSIEQAQERWKTMRGARFDATFATLDCYTESLSKAFPPAKLVTPFDVVSMQFCMHYAFETVQKARIMLENVSRWLRPGGIFLGTIPNAEQLLERLNSLPPDADDLVFGNSVYQIRFDEREKQPIFGHKYWFFLQDAVENVPEYIVRWQNFVEMATEYGLELKYKEEFHTIYEQHQEHPEFKPLLLHMHVVEDNGESAMDEDQWEAANIYIAFAFEKRP